ncbi:MAG: S8 family serine peptidase [Rhodobacteraceae bacterium]|jgi:subtilisin family serine protease|nr:S8 family serine peptidase [Paracoccaceae bacterium]
MALVSTARSAASRLCAGVLVCLAGIVPWAGAAVAADPRIVLGDGAGGVGPAGRTELLGRAAALGRLPVIVGFDLPVRPEGTLAPAMAAAQRSAIAARQEALLAPLGAAANVKRFVTTPAFAAALAPDDLAALLAAPGVTGIWEDVAVPVTLNDSVPLIEAPPVIRRGITGAGVAVAVLDSGVQRNHVAFAGRIVAEACFSTTEPGVSRSLCPGGAGSSTAPGSGRACPRTLANCFHGTHVAGIAVGDRRQRRGVAPGAGLISINVTSRQLTAASCAGVAPPCANPVTSDMIRGLEHVVALAATHRIAAVNMSLGGGSFPAHCDDQPMKQVVDTLLSLGITTVSTSGNNGFDGSVGFPGCISSVVTVGSTTKADAVSDFSNHARMVDLLAPGSDISAPALGRRTNGIETLSGTSQAAPHVAGALALLAAGAPGSTPADRLRALACSGLPVSRNDLARPRIRVFPALAFLGRVSIERIFTFRTARQVAEWEARSGRWRLFERALVGDADGAQLLTLATGPFCVQGDGALDVTATIMRGDPDNFTDWDTGILLMSELDADRNLSGLWFAYNSGEDRGRFEVDVTVWAIERYNIDTDRGSRPRILCRNTSFRGIDPHDFNRHRVVMKGGRLEFHLNGTQVCTADDPGTFTPVSLALMMAAPKGASLAQEHRVSVSHIIATATAAEAAAPPAAPAWTSFAGGVEPGEGPLFGRVRQGAAAAR